MTALRTRRTLVGVLAAAILTAIAVAAPGTRAAESPADVQSEYGVALALSGSTARAESVFVSLLSIARGDARALNNLGNLRLLRGESGVALAFYDRALRGDSADAGIHLNRATALLLIGDESRADQAAATAVRLAGGVDAAGALVGLKRETQAARGAEGKYISKEEIRSLLQRAAAQVPTDTSRGRAGSAQTETGKRKAAPTWRSAGPRSADASGTAAILYWKR